MEVLQTTQNKIKVKALDFTSVDKVGRDPKNKQGIIDFMEDKWIDKKYVQLIVDNSVKRDIKLKQLGIK